MCLKAHFRSPTVANSCTSPLLLTQTALHQGCLDPESKVILGLLCRFYGCSQHYVDDPWIFAYEPALENWRTMKKRRNIVVLHHSLLAAMAERCLHISARDRCRFYQVTGRVESYSLMMPSLITDCSPQNLSSGYWSLNFKVPLLALNLVLKKDKLTASWLDKAK